VAAIGTRLARDRISRRDNNLSKQLGLGQPDRDVVERGGRSRQD